MKKYHCNGTIFLFIIVLSISASASDWGTVRLDSLKQGVVVLENSKLLVRYKRHITDFRCNFIKDFILKDVNEDQAGESYGLDEIYHGHEGSGFLTNATVTYDGPDSITVLFEWSNGITIQQVTMFPHSTILKLHYIKYGTGICDIGGPGGVEQKLNNHKYIFYGGEKWHKKYVRYPLGYYYKPTPHDFGMTGWKGNGPGDPDPSPLSYRGYFIMGVYNPDNNNGFGRVMPVSVLDCINLIDGRGFEHVPYCKRPKQPYTGYLFGVTKGADEILSIGKKIVDEWIYPSAAKVHIR